MAREADIVTSVAGRLSRVSLGVYWPNHMATLAQSIPSVRAAFTSRWIINRGVDLSLVIGSSLAGYVYLGLNLLLGVPISTLWWFWSVGFDGTHIFGMASRTFFDREARLRNRRLLFGSLAFFFALGPT